VRNVFGLASHVVAELVPGSFAASARSSHSPVPKFLLHGQVAQLRRVLSAGQWGTSSACARCVPGLLSVPCAAFGKGIRARNHVPLA
jgi:hypothetical protein